MDWHRFAPAALAALAGIAAATQAAANAGLASRTGLGPALLLNTAVVLVGTVFLWVKQGASTAFFPKDAGWTLYLGGVCGFVIIAALATAYPKIGAARAVALLVVGQSIAALTIDHFGAFGMPQDPITLRRAAGLACACAGVVLMRA